MKKFYYGLAASLALVVSATASYKPSLATFIAEKLNVSTSAVTTTSFWTTVTSVIVVVICVLEYDPDFDEKKKDG